MSSRRDVPDVVHTRVLAVPFLARGAASVGLAAYVLRGQPTWSEIVRAAAWYALIDGALGLILGLLLVIRRLAPQFPLLTTITFGDAVIRIALGGVLLALPAIAEVPMTLVPMFGAVGAVSAVLGMAALIVWLLEHRRYHRTHRRGLAMLFDPLATIGFLCIAVGSLLFFNPPSSALELRDVIATAGIVLAASCAVSAVGALISATIPPSDARGE